MALDPGSTEFAFRPATLEPGDTVGIVAPASNVDPVALAKGCDALRQLGYKVIYEGRRFLPSTYISPVPSSVVPANSSECLRIRK